ncbi:MAG: hypothetical protein M3R08_04935 [Bacteroidota bacterium]|nr:hypothetical protein [Bacteroidota bacterium]
MKPAFLIAFFFGWIPFCLLAQDADSGYRNKYVFALIPSAADNIYGIAFGPIGSETICDPANTKHSHGLNLQIFGNGIFQAFLIGKEKFSDLVPVSDTMRISTVHNGLLISPFGTRTSVINGISISGWMSSSRRMNGISIDPLWNRCSQVKGLAIAAVNEAVSLRGVQLGIMNRCRESAGIQIGLWNRNEKRALPFFNWNFTGAPALAGRN